MTHYNLVHEQWLPVIFHDGTPGEVGLADCFSREDIADLAVQPHERIAVMRLLCCIVYATKGLSPDASGWRPEDVRADVAQYLAAWEGAFDLFDVRRPFLQIPDIEPGSSTSGTTPCDKLDFGLASGNNSSFSDPHARFSRVFSPARLAINLVAYQAFSPAGLMGTVNWRGKRSERSSADAPCISCSMLHVLRQRDTLPSTILANLRTRAELAAYEALGEGWLGRPVWERMPRDMDDEEAWHNATETFLGRMVPLARLIRLSPDGTTMLMGTGRKFPVYSDPQRAYPPETTAVLVPSRKKGKDADVLLGLLPGIALWRHVPALLAHARLSHDGRWSRPVETERLFVGGVIRDQSEIVDVVGAVLDLPSSLAADAGQRALRTHVLFAERIARMLAGAALRYGEASGLSGGTGGAGLRDRVVMAYWDGVHAALPLLRRAISDPCLWPKWRGQVLREAWRAYRDITPSASARCLRAACLGRRVLAGGISKILRTLTMETEVEE